MRGEGVPIYNASGEPGETARRILQFTLIAMFSLETIGTMTLISTNCVNTCGAILARLRCYALIYI